MSLRSVRARLTGLVLVAVLGLGVLSATLGIARVEDGLIDDAVAAAGDDQLIVVDEILGFQDEFEGVDLDDLEFVEEFIAVEELENLLQTFIELREADALDDLREAAGLGADDPVLVLTNFGLLVEVDTDEFELREADDDEVTMPIVPQTVVDELAFIALELTFEDVFGDDFASDEVPEEDDLLFATVERRGVDYLVLADVSDVRLSVDRIRTIVWVAVPLLTLGAAVLAWVLTGRALRPVHDITSRVGEISGGSLHERVPEPATGDEIAELAATMNAMLDRLEVDDRRLRRFVSDASHELRSPVAVLRSEAEVAARDPGQTSVEELADGVLGETLRLQRIVEDLLVLARGEERQAGGSGDVDVDDVVLAEAARRRRVPVDTTAVSAGRVIGSSDAVGRVVAHLLDNAARHAQTRVAVGLAMTDGVVELTVDDDGPGVPEAERQRVFERFTRLDDARTRDRGGAGLGLAVVAETVRGMRGTVSLAESSLGGARFVVRWPGRPMAD